MGTIANLAVGLTSSAAGFVAGMDAAKKSIDLYAGSVKSAKAIHEAMATPAERLGSQIDTLNKHFAKGKLDAQDYARALEHVHAGYAKATAGGGGLLGGIGSIVGIATGAEALDAAMSGVTGVLTAGANAAMQAGRAVVNLAESQAEAILKTDHMSKTLGVSVEELSRLEYGAKASHVSAESLTTGIRFLEMNLGQIASGGGKRAAEVIGHLNLNAATLQAEGGAKAFRDVAAALANVSDSSERMANVRGLLGRGGAELIPFIERGAQGMQELADEAEKTGNAISSIDAASVLSAAEAVDRLKALLEGVGNQIAIGIAPYVEALAKKTFDWGTSGEGAGERVAEAINEAVIATADLADWLLAGVRNFEELNRVADRFLINMAKMVGDQAGLANWTADLAKTDAWIAAYDAAQARGESWHNSAIAMIDDVKKHRDEAESDAAFWSDSGGGADFGEAPGAGGADFGAAAGVAKSAAKAAEQIEKLIERLESEQEAFGHSSAAAEIARLAHEGVSAALVQQASDANEAVEALKAHAEAMKELARLQAEAATAGMGAAERKRYEIEHGARYSADDKAALLGAIDAKEQADKRAELNKKQEKTEEAIQRMRDHIKELSQPSRGAAERQKIVNDFARSHPDATPQQTAAVQRLAAQTQAATEMQKWADEAKRLAEEGKLPLEKYNEKIDHVRKAYAAGKITFDEMGNAIKKVREELEKLANHSHAAGVLDAANMSLERGRALAGADAASNGADAAAEARTISFPKGWKRSNLNYGAAGVHGDWVTSGADAAEAASLRGDWVASGADAAGDQAGDADKRTISFPKGWNMHLAQDTRDQAGTGASAVGGLSASSGDQLGELVQLTALIQRGIDALVRSGLGGLNQ